MVENRCLVTLSGERIDRKTLMGFAEKIAYAKLAVLK